MFEWLKKLFGKKPSSVVPQPEGKPLNGTEKLFRMMEAGKIDPYCEVCEEITYKLWRECEDDPLCEGPICGVCRTPSQPWDLCDGSNPREELRKIGNRLIREAEERQKQRGIQEDLDLWREDLH